MAQHISSVTQAGTSAAKLLQQARQHLTGSNYAGQQRLPLQLLAHHMGISQSHLSAFPQQMVPQAVVDAFLAGLDQLKQGAPAGYVFGSTPFLEWDFAVDARALCPRPETEFLADWLCRHASGLLGKKPQTILDLCCGTGVLGIALGKSFNATRILMTDLSSSALVLARENAVRLDCDEVYQFAQGDLWQAVAGGDVFDLVVSNPPYVAEGDPVDRGVMAFEPREALYSSDSGLAHAKQILLDLDAHLACPGLAALELGFRHAHIFTPWLKDQDFAGKWFWLQDASEIPRFLIYGKGLTF